MRTTNNSQGPGARMGWQVDRRNLKILLALYDLEVRDFAEMMGFDRGYVSNVIGGFTHPSRKFRTRLGEVIATLMVGELEDNEDQLEMPL